MPSKIKFSTKIENAFVLAKKQRKTWLKLAIVFGFLPLAITTIYWASNHFALSLLIGMALTALLLHTREEPQTDTTEQAPETYTQNRCILFFSNDKEHIDGIQTAFKHPNITILSTDSVEHSRYLIETGTAHNLIIDTSLDTQLVETVAENCRKKSGLRKRLPLIALQKTYDIKVKLQILAQGFDDTLSIEFTPKEMKSYFHRWLQLRYIENIENSQDSVVQPGNPQSLKNKEVKKQPTPDTKNSEKKGKKKLRIVDIKQSLTASNNNYELAAEMLSMLVTMVGENRDELARLYQEKNAHELAELVHKIKGGCFMCGVPELTQSIKSLDQALTNQPLEAITPLFNSTLESIDHLLEWEGEHDIELIFSE